jgi:hypothetical protein
LSHDKFIECRKSWEIFALSIKKIASAALSGLVTPEDFDLSSGNITALTGT